MKPAPSGCWEWTGHTVDGYGSFRFAGKMVKSHRLSFAMYHGEFADRRCVLHLCDNRKCVNPDHLWLGTRADNNRDRDRKGRQVTKRGEDHKLSKLSVNDVRQIRKSDLPQRELAKKYSVSQGLINHIRRGRAWSHVN